MKLISCLVLAFLLVSINTIKEYPDAHLLILKDEQSTIDGIEIIEEPIFGVSYKDGVIRIIEGGTYIASGELNGKLHINTGIKVVKIILNGVNINSSINAIVFEDGYELINTIIDKDPYIIRSFDFNEAGAQIIIADDSINKLSGTEDGKKNGVIFSNITLHITGEEKGNGKLFVRSHKEGIEVYKHICISGGYINVAADDDGINTKTDKDSVVYIKGGKVLVNSGLGEEGDGIDGNGYIIIDGGEIRSAAQPRADSGLDSNSGTYINGGIVYAVGTSMDMAEEDSEQTTMNLIWEEGVNANSCISIRDINGTEVLKYNATDEEFIDGTLRRNYVAAIVSHPSFKPGDIFHLYMDGEQLGYTSNEKVGPGPGPGPNPGPGPSPGPGPDPGPGPKPPDPPLKVKELKDYNFKYDFILGEGATFYSGIQKYDASKNDGLILKAFNFSFYLISLILLNIWIIRE